MSETTTLDQAAIAHLAPGRVLRAAINLGNPNLAKQQGPGCSPFGVSVDLAAELARRCGLPLQTLCFPGAGKVVEAATSDQWDIAFLAIDPLRSQTVTFTAPYVLLSGSYVVRSDSVFTRSDDVDREGVHIVVGHGSAYDLYLSAAIKQARIVRVPTSDAVLETMRRENYEVAAGVRQQLKEQVLHVPELRLLGDSFMEIPQAMAVPKARAAGIGFLYSFIEEMKSSGFISNSLLRHEISGVAVADPA